MEQFKKAVGDVLETVAALRTLQTLISFHKVEFEQERGGGLDIDSLLEPVTDRLRAAGDVLADREDRIIEALNREGGNPAMTPEDVALILEAKEAAPETFGKFLAIMQAGGEYVTRLEEVLDQLDRDGVQ